MRGVEPADPHPPLPVFFDRPVNDRIARMSFAPGVRIGPYEILSLLGEGGMREVWKARDTRLDRTVAIKRLKGEHGARFQLEARAIAALNHPHICQIYDVGPDYLVLEYVEGLPLAGPMSTELALPLAQQIASALESAHSRGILHRDLKPANVVITEAGAKLLDFGLAKLTTDADLDATRTTDGVVMGTAAYMSPEQARGKPVDARSDIFSFRRRVVRNGVRAASIRWRVFPGNPPRRCRGGPGGAGFAALRRDQAMPGEGRVTTFSERCRTQGSVGRLLAHSSFGPALDSGVAIRQHEPRR